MQGKAVLAVGRGQLPCFDREAGCLKATSGGLNPWPAAGGYCDRGRARQRARELDLRSTRAWSVDERRHATSAKPALHPDALNGLPCRTLVSSLTSHRGLAPVGGRRRLATAAGQ
jgi:hypothetical protein